MKKTLYITLIITLVFLGCIKNDGDNQDKPEITLLSPAPCDTIYFDVPFTFQIKISDKDGLGNIKMDIHHNFGHHQHSDHEPCNMDEPKTAVNPYFNEWIFALPSDEKDYIFQTEITFPNDGYDTGDYHFHIYVTDNIGYQSFTSLAIKLQ
jgi:hypothetical protein